jgi:hypothetical protein
VCKRSRQDTSTDSVKSRMNLRNVVGRAVENGFISRGALEIEVWLNRL